MYLCIYHPSVYISVSISMYLYVCLSIYLPFYHLPIISYHLAYICLSLERALLQGIGFLSYGSWEAPLSAIYKLEFQESRWYSLKAWEPECRMGWILVPVCRPDTGDYCCPDQAVRQRVNSTFLCLFVLFRLSVDWRMPTCIGEGPLVHLVHQLKC